MSDAMLREPCPPDQYLENMRTLRCPTCGDITTGFHKDSKGTWVAEECLKCYREWVRAVTGF